MYGSTCLGISTKYTGVHGGTSTNVSKGNMVVREITCAHDEYEMHRPILEIDTNTVGKVQKGFSYADASHQGL